MHDEDDASYVTEDSGFEQQYGLRKTSTQRRSGSGLAAPIRQSIQKTD